MYTGETWDKIRCSFIEAPWEKFADNTQCEKHKLVNNLLQMEKKETMNKNDFLIKAYLWHDLKC